MSLKEDLVKEAGEIFSSKWETRDGIIVPLADNLKLSNDGSRIDATILYADLADSTKMVDYLTDTVAAEIYKAFLKCTCRIIRSMDGEITAFDGDRVMGIFIGDSKNTNAVKAGLKINWAVRNILNPEFKKVYSNSSFVITHGVGIDTSKILAARTGIRGANDIVWVGPAANYAAKLATLRTGNYTTWISENVFSMIHRDAKYSKDSQLMWDGRNWDEYSKMVYCSNYWWTL